MSNSLLIAINRPVEAVALRNLLIGAGYAVDVCGSGTEALKCIKKQKYSAAVLDYELLGMSGLRVAEHAARYQDEVTVILLVGHTAGVDAHDRRPGVYALFRKPFAKTRLLQTVAAAVEYHRVRHRLLTGEKTLREMMETSSDAVVIFEKEGRLLLANRNFSSLFGYRPQEFCCEKICPLIFDLTSVKPVPKNGDDGGMDRFEVEGFRKDGSGFPAQVRINYVTIGGKAIRMATIRDLSVRKQLQRQNEFYRRRLDESRHLETLGLMAGTVAHDLNNILSGIIGYPELILMDLPEDDRHAEDLRLIRDAGRRAAAVVSDLLTVTRSGSEKKDVGNLNTIVESYLTSPEYTSLSGKYSGIDVTTDLEGELFNIRCSLVHVNKVIMNLVANAVESAGISGRITIRTANRCVDSPIRGYETIPEGEYAVLTVEDDGPGISLTDLDHIFDPFYSKKQLGRSGTGLGLTVVKNTVKNHGGFIDVISSDRGTAFRLFFPITRESEKSVKDQGIVTYYGKGEKILVVDDKASQRDIACRILSRLGYKAYSVPSGEAAIEYTRHHSVDLLMLDMIMDPGINGRETYQRILQYAPGQKAIVVTGYALNEEAEQAKKLGVSQFLTKPYSIATLGRAIKHEIVN